MKILYLDCFAGISGDMAVGALIDAGVPLGVVREAVESIGIGGEEFSLSTRSIVRSQIHATKFDVAEHAALAATPHDVSAAHGHEHDGAHHHRAADDENGGTSKERGHHLRTLGDIVALIDRSSLGARARERAKSIFRAIAEAEARIHDQAPDDVHFHEVGALDSIADVVGFAAGLEHLGIDEVYASVIPLGSGGTIKTQHGMMPLPAPATVEILKGLPVRLSDLPFELTTPTGAGIVRAMSMGSLALDEIVVERVGYGAGTRELPDRPNLLRVILGERTARYDRDMVAAIETNVDDLNPQLFGYLFERLLSAGANECFVTPVLMKKGRPGHLLTVLAAPGAVEEISRIIFAETTSIGIRYREMSRLKLPRESLVVSTEFGPVRMKRVHVLGEVRTTPEYDDARRIAIERGMPLPEVMRRLMAAAERLREGDG